MAIWDSLGQKVTNLLSDLTLPDGPRETLRRAAVALDGKNAHEAEALSRQVLAVYPELARAWQILGLSLDAQERWDEAQAALERAFLHRGGELEVALTLVGIARRKNDHQAALKWSREALTLSSSDAELAQVYRVRGELFLEQGSVERAVRELRKALALDETPRLRGLLGRAHAQAGEPALARHHLERVAATNPPLREELLVLARLELEAGHLPEAQRPVQRLLEQDEGDAEARLIHARILLLRGHFEAAREEVLRSLSRDPHRPDGHELLGQVHAASHDLRPALGHLRTALQLARTPDDIKRLLETIIQLELLSLIEQIERLDLNTSDAVYLPPATSSPTTSSPATSSPATSSPATSSPEPGPVEAEAERLLRLGGDPPVPLALAALALTRRHRPEEARSLLERMTGLSPSGPALLARGALHLAWGEVEAAVVDLEAAARLLSDREPALSLLRRGYRLGAGLGSGAEPLYPLLPRLRALIEAHPRMAHLASEVARIKEVFDRPLLVCVMGEFSSGKSTLVNALIGEEVAAMGVTPTTATINLLTYGERRRARVWWRDDREELLGWGEVREFLASLDEQRADAIKQVELLYPAEELLRVNIVDTPGLNSLVEGHERTAREVLAQADAVLWLFSAQQAGKRTEEDALELLRRHRLKTVGVLNKIDQLTPEELEQVLAHLRRCFGPLAERVLPVSTRLALKALIAGDPALLEQSRFPELRRVLDEELFARSRDIKLEASQRRLRSLLWQALSALEAEQTALERVQAAADDLSRLAGFAFSVEELTLEGQRLEQDLLALYQQAASEVLEFVQPRRWALGEHRATQADRDFLLDLLSEGVERLCEASFQRLTQSVDRLGQELHGVLGALPPATLPHLSTFSRELDQLLLERRGLLRQQVFTRYTAFTRGFLLGGQLMSFWQQALPHLKLDPKAVFSALWSERVATSEELLEPLSLWAQAVREGVSSLIARFRLDLDIKALELRHRFQVPLQDVADALGSEDKGPGEARALE